MRRRPFIAAALFATLALAAVLVARRPQKGQVAVGGDETGQTEGPPPGAGSWTRHAPGAAIDSIQIERQGARTTIRRDGPRLRVTAPVDYPAEPIGARAAFDALDRLQLVSLVTDRSQRYPELGVDLAAGAHVRASHGGRQVLDLVIGKAVDEGSMVRLVRGAGSGGDAGGGGGRDDGGDRGGDQVWLGGADLHAIFDKSPADWRDRSITTFDARAASTIEIAAADGARLVVAKTDPGPHGEERWRLVTSTVKIGRLDQQVPHEIVATLSALKAHDFADGAAPAAERGLAPPALTVTVGLDDGKKAVVHLGNASGSQDYLVTNDQSPQVFLVARYDVERLDRRPIQFRDKTLCDISDADVIGIAVQHGADSYEIVKKAGEWGAIRPHDFKLDHSKVAPFPSVFRKWIAPRIVEAPPPIIQGRAGIIITGRSKNARCTIKVVGEPVGRQSYFVKIPSSVDLYEVPRWMIDRIAVKLGEIEASNR